MEKNISLDQLDLRILSLLQQNARLTNKEIGDRVFRSRSTIYERIKRMEDNGVIRRYAAILNPIKVNRSVVAFVHIRLKDHSRKTFDKFEEQMIRYPEVLDCYHVSGDHDFMLRVAVSDPTVYQEFLMDKVFEQPGVGSVLSSFVMKEAKSETPLTLDVHDKVIYKKT